MNDYDSRHYAESVLAEATMRETARRARADAAALERDADAERARRLDAIVAEQQCRLQESADTDGRARDLRPSAAWLALRPAAVFAPVPLFMIEE